MREMWETIKRNPKKSIAAASTTVCAIAGLLYPERADKVQKFLAAILGSFGN